MSTTYLEPAVCNLLELYGLRPFTRHGHETWLASPDGRALLVFSAWSLEEWITAVKGFAT